MAYLDKAGVTYLWNKIKSMFAKKKNGVYYVEGTNTETSVWTGTCADITEYYDGLVIAFKVSVTGASSTDTTLDINNLGAKKVVRNASTQVTTNYPANSVVIMTYTTDDGVGYWKIADYDANSYAYVRQYYTTTSADYPLLFKYDSGTSTTTSYVTKYSRYGNKIYANPSTGTVTATTFSGALSGNATSATKATQDGNGKTISSTYLPLSGGTLTGEVTINTGTTQSATKGFKWSAINSKNPYIGYATDQTDGTFVVGSLLGTNYASGLAIGGGSGNLLWKGTKVATATDLAGYSTTSHTHPYVSSMSVSGSTLTYNKGDGTSSSVTLPSSGGGSLEPTGVTAGTYGTYSSGSYYYVPNITVDEYGRLTNATQNYLGYADSKSDGLITSTMYTRIANNSHLASTSGNITADKDNYKSITTSTDIDTVSIYVYNASTASYEYIYCPKIYGVYVYAYIDATQTTQAFVPVKDYYTTTTISSKGNYAIVSYKFPSEFYDFNNGKSIRCVVLYERVYSTSSSSSTSM